MFDKGDKTLSELLLVNPRRKRRTTRRHRPMSALQRKYFGPKRRTRRRTARKTETLVTNPAPRRRVRRRRVSIGKRISRITHRSYGSFSPTSFVHDMLLPSAIGAAGALAADVVLGYASPHLPTFFKTGTGRSITKIGAAIGMSAIAARFANKRIGNQIIAGATIVTLYGVFHDFLKARVPTLSLMGEMEEMAEMEDMGEYVDGFGYVGAGYAVDGMGDLGRHKRRRRGPPPPMGGQGGYPGGQQQLGPGISAGVPPPVASGQFGPSGGAQQMPGGQGGGYGGQGGGYGQNGSSHAGIPGLTNPMVVQGMDEYVDGMDEF